MSNFWTKIFGKNRQKTEVVDQPQQNISDDHRHSCRYFIQYKFIPDMVDMVSKGDLTINVLFDVERWKNFVTSKMKEDFIFEWDELLCRGIKVDDDHVIVLYIFPKPRQVPEAAFAAAVVNTSNHNAQYYTLEYSFDNQWVLGGMNADQHLNFGCLPNPGIDSFIDWVVARAKMF